MYSTIVHPTDFSDASIPAIRAAHQLAKELRAKLIVCFIANPPLVADGVTLNDPNTNETRNISEELEKIQAADPAVTRELKLVIADKSSSVKAMLGIIQGMNTELIVMGMHNRVGIKGWFGKSITEEVVSKAKCAVLVVKDDQYSFEETQDS